MGAVNGVEKPEGQRVAVGNGKIESIVRGIKGTELKILVHNAE
jgi:hypothetical protein